MKPGAGDASSPRVPASVWLLAATAFLAPYIGGNLNVEASTLGPGSLRLLASIFDGVDTPGLADAVVVLGALACLIGLAWRRRVLQVPNNRVAVALVLLIAVITGSVTFSAFKSVSIAAWSHWVAYALVFFAATSATGRVRGPQVVLGAFVAGCSLSAVLGIREWGINRAIDPTWRIFAVWNNPNALAGILVLGLVVALGLTASTQRLAALGFGAAAVAIGLALFLTQSRGGLLAAAVGVITLAVLLSAWGGATRKVAALRILGTLATVVVLVAVIAIRSRSGSAEVGERLASTSSATAQSTAFRKNLWRGAARSVAMHPLGTGVGTYFFYSAESGLTTETQLAHNTPLQLAVESSSLAPATLVVFFVLWLIAVLRGRRPEPQAALLRAAIVAAICAAAVDGMFESNLYYFGTGVAVFLLMGLGLQLAADAVAPEFSPPMMRRSIAAGAITVLAILTFFGYREVTKSRVRYDRAMGLEPDFHSLMTLAEGDGEAHYLRGFDPSLSGAERLAEFRRAAQLEPSLKHLMLLADAYAQSGNPIKAGETYRDALALDPNNLDVLYRLMSCERSSDEPDDAIATARRLIEVERKPYFTVRALSEIVPLQTADARTFLAGQTTDRTEAASQLAAAAKLYADFATRTLPYLRKSWGDVPTQLPMAGYTQSETVARLQQGVQVAKSAATAYRTLHRDADAAAMDRDALDIQGDLNAFTRALAGNK